VLEAYAASTLLAQVRMKVICAWCENEGRETLIGEIGLYDVDMTSHGICLDHEKVLLNQIDQLKRKQVPRLRRSRRPAAQPRSSSLPVMPHCATPWRRRRQHRMSPAQLTLPFDDGAKAPNLSDPQWQLVPAPVAGSKEST
jgi:hypothetical protein